MTDKKNNCLPVEECRIEIPYRYPLIFTQEVFGQNNPVLAETLAGHRHSSSPVRARIWFDQGLVDANPDLLNSCQSYFLKYLPEVHLAVPAVFPGGEPVKDGWSHVNRMLDDLLEHRLCRHSYLIVVGGGAFLDAAGLAAALFHRGIRLVRLPTTTLSQDDSGVGVKNGINLSNCKNLIGTFAPPFAVVNDLDLLDTLDPDVMRDGLSEAFKVGIIKDRSFFEFLRDNAAALKAGTKPVMHAAIKRCAFLHLDHIQNTGDPFEMGSARPLDFGHWAAHRLEAMSDYDLRHGQGVAIGIALDSYYAYKKELITSDEFDDIITAIVGTGLPIYHSLLSQKNAEGGYDVLAGIEQFREHLGGTLSVTLPDGIGRKLEVSDLDLNIIRDGIVWLEKKSQ